MCARLDKLNFSTTGAGTSRLVGEWFKSRTGVLFGYVAYKGGGLTTISK